MEWTTEWQGYNQSLNNIKDLLSRFIIFHDKGQEYKHPHTTPPQQYWHTYRTLVILILKNDDFHPVARLHAASPLPQNKLHNINTHNIINQYEQELNQHRIPTTFRTTAQELLPSITQAVEQLHKEQWQPQQLTPTQPQPLTPARPYKPEQHHIRA